MRLAIVSDVFLKPTLIHIAKTRLPPLFIAPHYPRARRVPKCSDDPSHCLG